MLMETVPYMTLYDEKHYTHEDDLWFSLTECMESIIMIMY
jgi:hypothetical protein